MEPFTWIIQKDKSSFDIWTSKANLIYIDIYLVDPIESMYVWYMYLHLLGFYGKCR